MTLTVNKIQFIDEEIPRYRHDQQLEFIQESGSGVEDARRKQLVRRHVMYNYRREIGQRKNQQAVQLSRKKHEDDKTVDVQRDIVGNGERFQISSLALLRYPATVFKPTGELLNYYQSHILHECPSLERHRADSNHCPERELFQWAMGDPTVFHAILAWAALHRDLASGREQSIERLLHLRQAILHVTKRLSNPTESISDSTIAAVVHLATTEGTSGNYETWSHHMDGLHKMVHLRGGLSAFPKPLQQLIRTAALFLYTVENDTRRLSWFTDKDDPICCGLFIKCSYTHPSSGSIKLDNRLLNCINVLKEVGFVYEYASHVGSQPNSLAIASVTQMIARQLHSLTLGEGPATVDEIVQQICRCAIIIYAGTLSLELAILMQLTENFVQRLKDLLDKVNTIDVNPAILVWSIIIGGIYSQDEWFVDKLRSMASSLVSKPFHPEIAAILLDLPWVKSVHDAHAVRLWKKAAAQRLN